MCADGESGKGICMLKYSAIVLAAAATVAFATPASAAVEIVLASSGQGTLVHGTGTLQEGLTVTGNLGPGGPTIVNFTGDTTGPNDFLRIQQGQGQADVTGAEITLGGPANDLYNMLSGNIFLTGGLAIDYIEFALTSGTAGTINFTITGSDGTTTFLNQLIGEGNTFFAFNTTGASTITNVMFSAVSPLEITLLKQVRIDTTVAAVPEPATWVMMLIGFGAMGYSVRRRRKANGLLQVA